MTFMARRRRSVADATSLPLKQSQPRVIVRLNLSPRLQSKPLRPEFFVGGRKSSVGPLPYGALATARTARGNAFGNMVVESGSDGEGGGSFEDADGNTRLPRSPMAADNTTGVYPPFTRTLAPAMSLLTATTVDAALGLDAATLDVDN